MDEKEKLKFVTQLNDGELIELIHKCTGSEDEVLASSVRHPKEKDGNLYMVVSTGKGRQPLFYYEMTDTTINRFFSSSQPDPLENGNVVLRSFLAERFENEYKEFLGEQGLTSPTGSGLS